MEESIVFDPLIDERSLDREASKVDQRLEQSGTITPDLDDSQLGDIDLDGVGGVSGGGGGGVGGGEAAGAAALASKIPKPIAGVAVSAAIPVALGGAVGAGMLSAMHSASARLQTSTSMIGQAWSMFWRPFGNRLDELFIRDIATNLLSTMVEFNELAQNEGLMVGLQWLASGAETALANAVGGAVEGGLETIGLDLDIGGDVSNFLRDVDWFKVLTGGPAGIAKGFGGAAAQAVAKWIGNEFPNVTSEEVMAALTFDPVVGAMIAEKLSFDPVSAAKLLAKIAFAPIGAGLLVGELTFRAVTGDSLLREMEFGSVPGSGILEETFGAVALTADDIIEAITGGGGGGGDDDVSFGPDPGPPGRPPNDGGDGGGGGADVGGGGGRSRRPPGFWDWDPDDGSDMPGALPGPGAGGGMQRGGVVSRPTRTTVGEAGAEVVQPLSEFERMIERVAGSTGGESVDTTPIERKLDRLHRDLRALSDAMSSMTIEVDGETLGRAATNARHNKLFDSDSLI